MKLSELIQKELQEMEDNLEPSTMIDWFKNYNNSLLNNILEFIEGEKNKINICLEDSEQYDESYIRTLEAELKALQLIEDYIKEAKSLPKEDLVSKSEKIDTKIKRS